MSVHVWVMGECYHFLELIMHYAWGPVIKRYDKWIIRKGLLTPNAWRTRWKWSYMYMCNDSVDYWLCNNCQWNIWEAIGTCWCIQRSFGITKIRWNCLHFAEILSTAHINGYTGLHHMQHESFDHIFQLFFIIFQIWGYLNSNPFQGIFLLWHSSKLT